ncbi:hypothetical protein IJ103_02935, partial [Candidatus Saccharibacteria bacterium]|nr:hypothetical protein [Candidatus Saccharibacteria bacterium]
PEERKKTFIEQTKAEFELRVGEAISKGLSEEQVKEFAALSEGDQKAIRKVVFEMDSDFRDDPVYKTLLKQSGKESGDWAVLGEYLSVRWIQKNRPDYRAVVEKVFRELKEEIKQKGA